MTIARVGLLAGEGKMPRLIIEHMRSAGCWIFLLAVKDRTPPDLFPLVDDVVIFGFTQLGSAIRECRKRGVNELSIAGRIQHTAIFSLKTLMMDWTTLRLLWSLPDWRADTILCGIVNCFEKKGVTVVSSVKYLKDLLAKEGVLTRRAPNSKDMDALRFGVEIARRMGDLDVGQTIVIKGKSVVAVEAMEGTDACLERAGCIAGEGCIAVKLAKPRQDMRFDVPVIGLNTLEKLVKIRAKGLVVEAGKTLFLDEEMRAFADKHDLFIVALGLEKTSLSPCLINNNGNGVG